MAYFKVDKMCIERQLIYAHMGKTNLLGGGFVFCVLI